MLPVLDPTPDLPIKNTFIEFSSPSSAQVRQRTCPPCIGCSRARFGCFSPGPGSKAALEDVSTGDESSSRSVSAERQAQQAKARAAAAADASREAALAAMPAALAAPARPAAPAADAWTEVPSKKDRKRRGAREADALAPATAAVDVPVAPLAPSRVREAVPAVPATPARAQVPTPVAKVERRAAPTSAGSQRSAKFACRFLIGIEDEPAFKVVKRLLGPGGENLKNVIDRSGGAKLCLRGQGSRCLEGSANVESSDPLMICVSAPSQASLEQAAVKLAELVDSVHVAYRQFCAKRKTPVPNLVVRQDAQDADELEKLLQRRR